MSVCTDQPSADLLALIEAFSARPDVRHVAVHPKGNCGAMAVRFAETCIEDGLDAKVRAFDRWEDDPAEYRQRVTDDPGYANWSLGRHFTTVVTDKDGRDWDVDWTAHQFDAGAERPRVVPADCCDDCLLPNDDEPFWAWSDLHDLDEARSEAIDLVAREDLPPAHDALIG